MLRLTAKTIRARWTRFLLSAVAVTLGVAFMSGTLVLTETIRGAYDELVDGGFEGTDVFVRSSNTVGSVDTGELRGTIDESVLSAVRSTPGVEVAEPAVVGIAQIVGDDGELLDDSSNRATPLAFAYQSDPRLSPLDIVSGRGPEADDEIVIDQSSAEAGGFTVGDSVRVVTSQGSQPYRLAGIATYAGTDDAGGAQVVAFTPATASAQLGEPGRYDAVSVIAEDGVSPTELVGAIEEELVGATDVEVLTAAEAVDSAKDDVAENLAFFNTFLTVFAVVALMVGAFVISNTFSITVAQRTTDNALLRALGASRRQVMRSVMFEALFTGLVASAVGAVAGIGAAKALQALLEWSGIGLPEGSTVIGSSTIVTSIVVGTLVTLVSAIAPARKAGRISPLAAMRDVAIDRSGRSLRRTLIGSAVTLLGVALIALGLGGGAPLQVGLGAAAIFLGVSMLGPVIAQPGARLLGAPLTRLRGTTGQLAKENAARSPRRTAATASALMVGVGLVAFITVLAASARASLADSVDEGLTGDWIVSTQWGQGGVDPTVAERLDALPETGAVASMRVTPAMVGDTDIELTGIQTQTMSEVVDLDVVSGSIADLGLDGIAVNEDTATDEDLSLGDQVVVTFAETGDQTFTVRAVYDIIDPLGPYSLSLEGFEANVADRADQYVFVADAEGVGSEAARSAMEGVLDGYPTAQVMNGEEFSSSLGDDINQVLNLVYALLALAVLIALFGIANTLALAVHERTREIGLLRAVGMSRAQVRAAVRWEAAIIALLGTALGMGIGLGFAWALVQALEGEGIFLSLPYVSLAAIVVVGAFAGVVAAALPARRAARLDVLRALQTT